MPNAEGVKIILWIVGSFLGLLGIFFGIIKYSIDSKYSAVSASTGNIFAKIDDLEKHVFDRIKHSETITSKKIDDLKESFNSKIDEIKTDISEAKDISRYEDKVIHDRIDKIEERLNNHVESPLHVDRRQNIKGII